MRAPEHREQARRNLASVAFDNRVDAGRRLAVMLGRYRASRPLVLGIPRGGVPVAAEVARALHGDLDVIVARKLGAPLSPELAVGAVTADGVHYLHEENLETLGVTQEYLAREMDAQAREADAREHRFRAGRPAKPVQGRTVLLIDDGLATGSTIVAAARSIRRRTPARLIIAVPVGPREVCESLRAEADDVVCLEQPSPFYAVGMHYRDFGQTEDAEVIRLLDQVRHGAVATAS